MLRVTDECSFQPAGGERWSCICKSSCGINATALIQEDLLQNQAFILVDFKNVIIITVCSGSYFLELIHLIETKTERCGVLCVLMQLK